MSKKENNSTHKSAENHLFKAHEALAEMGYAVGVDGAVDGDTYQAIDIFYEHIKVTMCGHSGKGGKWLTKPHMKECMPIWFGDKVSNV